jgi:molybdopterin molybdotransferase
LRRFRIQATQAAGAPPLKLASGENAIEVMTGAVLPLASRLRDSRRAIRCRRRRRVAEIGHYLDPYHNVHRRGSDSRQGTLLLESGTLLRAPEIAVAASAGMARVRVSSQPAVMVVSTGDELIEPGDPIADFQVRRSNAYAVAATLRKRGFGRVGDDHVPDDADMLRERLKLHLTTHEVVILSGGVSMGKFDLVPKVLMQFGVEACSTTSRSGPASRCGSASAPGPVGVRVAGKSRLHARLPDPLCDSRNCRGDGDAPCAARAPGAGRSGDVSAALAYFLPVAIEHDDWGRPWANPRAPNGSGDF